MSLQIQLSDFTTVKVPVTAGTTLQSVLETVCEKKGLTPAKCGLQHRNKLVDLSLVYRLSGIPNMAKLELVQNVKPSAKKAGGSGRVRIAFQTESGRVKLEADSGAVLWDLLQDLQTQGSVDLTRAGMKPVLEVQGTRVATMTELQSETLKSAFGVSSGSIMINLSFAAEDPVAEAAAEQALACKEEDEAEAMARQAEEMMKKAAAMKAAAAAKKSAAGTAPARPAALPTRVVADPAPPAARPAPAAPPAPPASGGGVPPATGPPPVLDLGNVHHALRQLRDEATGNGELKTALETMSKIVGNVMSKPGDPRPRSIKFMNKAFQERVGRHRAGLLLMEAIGFQLHVTDDTMYLRGEDPLFLRQVVQSLDKELFEFKAAAALANELAPAISRSSAAPAPSRPLNSVQTKEGLKTPTEIKVDKLIAMKEAPLEEDPRFDRELKLFLPNDPAGEARIDDKEFSLTGTDLSSMGLGKKRKAGDEPEMLKTKAMRELERLQNLKMYSKTIIRIRLPNQCILQGSFHPRERVSALQDFVQGCLASKAARFSLHSGHPLSELDNDVQQKSFVQALLTPSAVCHFRWVGGAPDGPLLTEAVTAGMGVEVPDVEKARVAGGGATLAAGAAMGGSSGAAPGPGTRGTQRDAEARKAVEDRMKAFMNMK